MTWTRERILRAIDAWHRSHLRAPSARDWWNAGDGHPSHWTVRRAFGSWNAALSAAGMRTRARGEVRVRGPRERCPETGRFRAREQSAVHGSSSACEDVPVVGDVLGYKHNAF